MAQNDLEISKKISAEILLKSYCVLDSSNYKAHISIGSNSSNKIGDSKEVLFNDELDGSITAQTGDGLPYLVSVPSGTTTIKYIFIGTSNNFKSEATIELEQNEQVEFNEDSIFFLANLKILLTEE